LFALERHGFLETLGTENVCPDVESALLRAREVMSQAKSPAPDK
jgi:hypothetical protein